MANFEKLEGMTFIDDKKFAIIADNDFGVGDLIEPKTGTINPEIGEKSSSLFVVELEE